MEANFSYSESYKGVKDKSIERFARQIPEPLAKELHHNRGSITNSDVKLQRSYIKLLKELRNCLLRTSLEWPLFCSIRVYTSLYFLPILLENLFFCLPAVFVITACSEFHVLFINFLNICTTIIYIVGVMCFCSHLSLLTFKQFVRTNTCHKNLQPLIKICLQAAFEF